MPRIAPRSPRPSSKVSGRRDRLSAVPEALFAYGTLRSPDVLSALLDRVPDNSPGVVRGWRVAALPERVYPVLIPGEASATGAVITGLSVEEWRVIDAFEDDLYDLHEIILVDGRRAWAYLTHDEEVGLAVDWSIDDFRIRHAAAYSKNCRAWRNRYDRKRGG